MEKFQFQSFITSTQTLCHIHILVIMLCEICGLIGYTYDLAIESNIACHDALVTFSVLLDHNIWQIVHNCHLVSLLVIQILGKQQNMYCTKDIHSDCWFPYKKLFVSMYHIIPYYAIDISIHACSQDFVYFIWQFHPCFIMILTYIYVRIHLILLWGSDNFDSKFVGGGG